MITADAGKQGNRIMQFADQHWLNRHDFNLSLTDRRSGGLSIKNKLYAGVAGVK
jgi:hypothetical protein